MKRIQLILWAMFAILHPVPAAAEVILGAARTNLYIPALKGKKVALMSNHTGMVGDIHILDILLANNIDVAVIFSPEHGFRGTADAGEHIGPSVDPLTGIPIASMYDGGLREPRAEVMDGFDVLVFDIQDVGLRYYTYYCTMLDLMRASARHGKKFIVLDRPNPNGMYVDGPVLDMAYQSGVGRLPIPVVHGMTLGELALMIQGEGWLGDGLELDLTVVPMDGYTHQTRYRLPVAPSPNLKNMHAIYLYPSICYFEGTRISLGRGTDWPFEIYGHPDMKNCNFEFTPHSVPGARNPPLIDEQCYGRDLRDLPDEEIISAGINLDYVIDAYRNTDLGSGFFTDFFLYLIGKPYVQQMIAEGRTSVEIKACWADDVEQFRKQRSPYLLYAE